MSGKNNEDSYRVSAHRLSQTNPTPSVLAVLADGVGGHQAGEVAAKISTETINNIIIDSDGGDPLGILEYAIVHAGQDVANQAGVNHDYKGMGSTCACTWVIGDRLYAASVGDSRIYLIRDGLIQQLTTDHTWVQEAIDHGIIQPEEARNHPRAHIIRRYLGSRTPVVPDFRLHLHPSENDQEALSNQGMNLLPGDILLLCSDGLTDLVDDLEILEIIQTRSNDQAIHALVDLANHRGGHDNITIITLEMPESGVKTFRLREKQGKKWKLSWPLILIISALVIAIAALGTLLFQYTTSTPGTTPSATPIVETIELVFPTENVTKAAAPTASLTQTPTITPIQETYTPWPTHTYPPEN
jgi:protein phosphatase